MAKYKQVFSFDNEDSFGNNTIEVFITDNINLINDDTEPQVVDCMIIDKLEKAFQSDNGGLRMDYGSIITADWLANTQNDLDCIELLKSALTNKIYVATIINPNVPIEDDDYLFIGIISPEYEEEAINWNRDEYQEEATINNSYSFSINPAVESLFDDIILSDIISNIDNTWIGANVENKQGFIKDHRAKGTYQSYDLNVEVCDLVNLNKLIRKITDEAENILNTDLGTEYTIDYKTAAKLPGKYAPARFRRYKDDSIYISSSVEKPNYSDFKEKWEDIEVYHNLNDATDFFDYYIDPDERNFPTDNNTIYVDFKYIKDIGNTYEYQQSTASNYRLGNPDSQSTFTDFLYSFAENFNFLLLLEINILSNKISITFIDRDYIDSSNKIYFKDAVIYKKDSIGISTLFGDVTKYYNEAFYGLQGDRYGSENENNGGYIYGKDRDGINFPDDSSRPVSRNIDESNKEMKKIMFGISPTVARLLLKDIVFLSQDLYLRFNKGELYPHNNILVGNNILTPSINFDVNHFATNTRSLHTAMYIKANQKISSEPEQYFTPIRAMAVKIDDEERYFDSLEAFLNSKFKRYDFYLENKVNLDIPYWNAFSNSSDGSNPSLKNLKLGKKITLNEIDYTITKIDYGINEPNIKLELLNQSYITKIENPTSAKSGPTLNSVSSPEMIENQYDDTYERDFIKGIANKFTALYYNDEGALEAITHPDHVESYAGLCLEDAINDSVSKIIKSPGIYYVPNLPYDIGDKLYLRISGTPTNIETFYIKKRLSPTDCIYKYIGKVIKEDTIKLVNSEYYIYV